jgi:transposase
VRFEELTDDQWKLLVPSIPLPAYTGRPRADDRNYINGILYVLMSGCRWMEKYYQVPSVTGIFFWIDKDRRPFRG